MNRRTQGHARAFDPTDFLRREALADLRPFMGLAQHLTLDACSRGEEAEHFIAKAVELAATIQAMPATGGTREQADPVAQLHYFHRYADFWIIEKDIDTDGLGQVQAFGLATINGAEPELGYISIQEITQGGAELDYHFRPRPLSDVRRRADVMR